MTHEGEGSQRQLEDGGVVQWGAEVKRLGASERA